MNELNGYLEIYIMVVLMGFSTGSLLELLMYGIVKAFGLFRIQK